LARWKSGEAAAAHPEQGDIDDGIPSYEGYAVVSASIGEYDYCAIGATHHMPIAY